MPRLQALRPVMPILIGASLLLVIATGVRHSLGLFVTPLTKELVLPVSDFTLAIAVQNLTWGVLQPFVGVLAVRWGYRRLMVMGAALYLLGLLLLATAQGFWWVLLGAGVTIGMAMTATGNAIALAAVSRAVPAQMRSLVLGFVAAAGSMGALFSAPLGQAVTQTWGWRAGVIAFVIIGLILLPAAWSAGRADQTPLPAPPTGQRVRQVLSATLRHKQYLVMTLTHAVCGMQLVFLSTHLPAYLDLCGMNPMLSAQALGLIGGFNVLGSLFFGWAGGRFNKLFLLGLIYVLRSGVFVWYFHTAPTPTSTLVFSSVMGFLWLGVSPLVHGWIAQTFDLRWQVLIVGITFFSHQVGSFLGAYGGGLLYDLLRSYTVAWQIGAGAGVAAGSVQMFFALRSNPGPLSVARAAGH